MVQNDEMADELAADQFDLSMMPLPILPTFPILLQQVTGGSASSKSTTAFIGTALAVASFCRPSIQASILFCEPALFSSQMTLSLLGYAES